MLQPQTSTSQSQSAQKVRGQFHHEDIVRRVDRNNHPDEAGVVLRCWHNEEELQNQDLAEAEGISRALKKGETGVAWYPSGKREILLEDDVVVTDRMFHVGDVCKRSLKDISSGVVLQFKMQLELEHALSKQRLSQKVPAEEVQNTLRIVSGDHVVAQGWVGVVEEVFEEAVVESSEQRDLIQVCDIGSRLAVGEVQEDLLSTANSFWATLFPFQRTPSKATILDVKQTVACVNWLAINQKLTPEEQDRRRPKRYWTDLDKLTLVRSFSESCHAVGDKVIFRSPELVEKYGLFVTRHGPEDLPVEVMNVVDSTSTVRILWQDGTETEEDAKALVPYVNLDEYESWPGDWVVWKGEGQSKIGVVQIMNPEDRTAEVRWYGTEETELVPALELDVHGPDPVTFGVHRGDVVFISDSPTGMEVPSLARIGEPEEMPDALDLRHLLGKHGMDVAKRSQHSEAPRRLAMPGAEADDIDWYGTVSDLRLDGQIEVTLPNKKKIMTTIDRLTLLTGGYEEDLHGGWDEDEDIGSETDSEMDEDVVWTDDAGQVVVPQQDDWEDFGEGDEVAEITPCTEQDGDEVMAANEKQGDTKAKNFVEPSQADPWNGQVSQEASAKMPTDDARWSRFEVLEEVPADHAFAKEAFTPPKAAFFKRLQKEFKILQSSLPDSVLVRSYEDRSDLLRVLIIGSEGTPYEYAPFVIDFLLKPSYPYEPPVAYFHSWTNGSGRVSPNLYEEGKVCLSVLGTWSGQAESESWSPTKSSLLQVFVSIQGLVLVREPWFTEPAYEKLKGTEEGEVNSRLYSEKAYILARGFIRKALEQPPAGLKDELNYFYYTQGRLQSVVEKSRKLIETAGQELPPGEPVARLSKGGCIILKRTLTVLEKLCTEKPSSS